MRKFNLEEWKKHPTLEVVTKDGRPVKIISTEANDFAPVVGLIDGLPRMFSPSGEICISLPIDVNHKNIFFKDHNNNLYFSDKNEIELNPFESYLYDLMSANAYVSEETVKYEANILANLHWNVLRQKYVIVEEDKYMDLVNKLHELQNK